MSRTAAAAASRGCRFHRGPPLLLQHSRSQKDEEMEGGVRGSRDGEMMKQREKREGGEDGLWGRGGVTYYNRETAKS